MALETLITTGLQLTFSNPLQILKKLDPLSILGREFPYRSGLRLFERLGPIGKSFPVLIFISSANVILRLVGNCTEQAKSIEFMTTGQLISPKSLCSLRIL